MAFVEDLAPFFNTRDFAVAALWKGVTSVDGIFGAPYRSPLDDIVEASAPTFTCASADIATVAHGDSLAIGAKTYKVAAVEPDGTGVTLLRLEEQ